MPRYLVAEDPHGVSSAVRVVVNVKDKFEETHLTHLVVKAYVFDTRYENSFATDLTSRIKKELSRRKLIPSDVRFTDVVDE